MSENNNSTSDINKKTRLCKFYLNGFCKKEDACTFIHERKNLKKNRHNNLKNKKNTESFDPMNRPVDLRILYDLSDTRLSVQLTDRDLLLVPNLFKSYAKNELYNKLIDEIKECELKKTNLLKLWHGNDKIAGTHLIADDKLNWKNECPTFNKILDRLVDFFNVDIKATRFNWYTNSDQWKPFHHDAAAFDPRKEKSQNITIALSFGMTRYTALEFHEENINKEKTTISIPIADGEIYVFSNTTNKLWKHGILQEKKYQEEGRVSIIIWGWVNGLTKLE